MSWIFINTARSWMFIHMNTTPIYQLDMSWILSTLIRFGYLFPRIELQNLSTEYVLDIYQHEYNSHFYQHE